MHYTKLPSQELLLSLFDYNPETGEGTWIKSISNRAGVGASISKDQVHDYRRVTIFGKTFAWHRVIYKMHHGSFDESLHIDHINGDKKDNSIQNLRLVTPSDNHKNQKLSRHNTSGRIGISWQSARNKWEAYITSGGKLHKLGRFTELKDAIEARAKAEMSLGFHQNHGRIEVVT